MLKRAVLVVVRLLATREHNRLGSGLDTIWSFIIIVRKAQYFTKAPSVLSMLIASIPGDVLGGHRGC